MRILFLIGLLYFAPTRLMAETHPEPFPPALQYILDGEYPGCELATLKKRGRDERPYEKDTFSNILRADLDGDGSHDYVIEITYLDDKSDVRLAALAFLTRGNSFKHYVLIELWLGPEHKNVSAPVDTVLKLVTREEAQKDAKDGGVTRELRNFSQAQSGPLIEILTKDKPIALVQYDATGFQQFLRGR